jgi:hypothetical protein
MDEFLRDFKARNGRSLRVLLIGNIANYAFVLAKLLRRAGVDCYVADPDFYHIMASPEWLDADFKGDWGDDFFPRWSKIDLGNYKRPNWFIQAPAGETFAHLSKLGRADQPEAVKQNWWMTFSRKMATGDVPAFAKIVLNSNNVIVVFVRRAVGWIGRQLKALGTSKPQNTSPAETAKTLTTPFQELGLSPKMEEHFHRTGYLAATETYRQALNHFDIVQGFTVSAIFAALSAHPRFCAIELGTLRGLPFEDSDIGRLTAWLYLRAPEVQITNVDCVTAADRLGLPKERQHKVLHPYDTQAALDYARTHPVASKPFFLAPARHHWKNGNASWLKGNDIIIRAAGLLARAGYQFGVTFTEWGEEVELSKALIREEGIEAFCTWIKPQPRLALWPLYLSCAAVIDQFQAASFGGVGLDTMSLGKRLISRYDEEAGSQFFTTPPPFFNCTHIDQVTDAMKICLDDLQDMAGRGQTLQSWVNDHHGPERQLHDQFLVFQSLLEKAPL